MAIFRALPPLCQTKRNTLSMLENRLYKKLIPQFVCIYYLDLILKTHSTTLSSQTVDNTPVE